MNAIDSIISHLERQKTAIDRAISALRDVEGLHPSQAKSESRVAKQIRKRRMSAAGRRKIAEAARKRWADKRAAEAALAEKTGPAKKGFLKRAAQKAKSSAAA